jgi:hypothetical protein
VRDCNEWDVTSGMRERDAAKGGCGDRD